MSQFTTISTHFSTLLLTDLFLLCSFILSHPLYFSYFIFFSPYLLRILSFLSPLFITTSLLLLVLLTVSPSILVHDTPSPPHLETKVGFLLSSYNKVLNTLSSSFDDGTHEEFCLFEDLEACIGVLEKSIFEVGEVPLVEFSETSIELPIPLDIHVDESFPTYHALPDLPKEVELNVEEYKYVVDSFIPQSQVTDIHVDSIGLESNHIIEESQSKSPPVIIEPAVAKLEVCSISTLKDNASEAMTKVPTPTMDSLNMLDSCGSMRREKEWKRTLACKLYEERQNVGGGEGMDLLWEDYESDTGKKSTKANDKKDSKVKKEKKREIQYSSDEDDEEEEEDDEQEMNAQLCCLQALKFSTRKMNLGMRKPSLVKISKALKGMGWFHHGSKHGKKA